MNINRDQIEINVGFNKVQNPNLKQNTQIIQIKKDLRDAQTQFFSFFLAHNCMLKYH